MREEIPLSTLAVGEKVRVLFQVDATQPGEWAGYGGWFYFEGDVQVSVTGGPKKKTASTFGPGIWNKVGSLWRMDGAEPVSVEVVLTANAHSKIALYEMNAGHVQHDYLEDARDSLTRNMYAFAPEANVYVPGKSAEVTISIPEEGRDSTGILLKSCNRCARYLPINESPAERSTLSFSNHCVAAHRRPCRHKGFGILTEEDGSLLRMEYGYQLECRFCKKFAVNAALNPMRNAAQMKEDGARRRTLEQLLDALYEGSPQLRYRRSTGRELVDEVWKRFDGKCFKCGHGLESKRKMHLDHTRPLALLWPLDATATALCSTHNTEKRDRPPVEYYTQGELERLSRLTGCSLDELKNPAPNVDALDRLCSRLNWFFDDFLSTPQMTVVRDGKVTGELVIKALVKVMAYTDRTDWPDLTAEYDKRR